MPQTTAHSQFDIARWKKRFPYASLFRHDYPRHFNSSHPDDVLDLRKPAGDIISTPKNLIQTIQVRETVGKVRKLRESSRSDVFVWGKSAPKKPYLTKVGGIPYRPRDAAWPARNGVPATFLFQICFIDSRDLLDRKVPGDVMVVFGYGQNFWACAEDMIIEWHRVNPKMKPWKSSDIPRPEFYVPKLTGHRCRIPEFRSADPFADEGHSEVSLLALTQATKIGREINWVQGSVMEKGERLIAGFSSIYAKENPWPLVDVRSFPFVEGFKGYFGYQNELSFGLGDGGCIYFIQDTKGRIRWEFQC